MEEDRICISIKRLKGLIKVLQRSGCEAEYCKTFTTNMLNEISCENEEVGDELYAVLDSTMAKEKEKEERMLKHEEIIAAGSGVTNYFDGDMGVVVSGSQVSHDLNVSSVARETEVPKNFEDIPLYVELLPIFMNVKEEVVKFVKAIGGQKPTAITDHVNKLLKEGKMSRSCCKSNLHDILNRYGFYKAKLSNWNMHVN